MKKMMLILAVAGTAAFTGCSTASGGHANVQPTADTGTRAAPTAMPRYEHQLQVEPVDGDTPFLRLVAVRDP